VQVELLIAIIALIVAGLALAWAFALGQRLRRLTALRGEMGRMAAAGDFAGIAQAVQARLEELDAADERLRADDEALGRLLGKAIRHLGIVRFDALAGDVGENSFSVALLDDSATGFVLTSMYGRGAYRLYAKPVADGLAELVLTEEEAGACARALQGTGLSVASEGRRRHGRDG
jgi:hypothetical protein